MLKIKLVISVLSVAFYCGADASMSYGSKFLLTTISGCAAGGLGSYAYASNSGYDSQPRGIITWMGAATGCLSGAVFSYFFYDDNTQDLNTQISAQNKTISDLTIQLSEMQGQKQSEGFNPPKIIGNYPDPFNDFKVSEGIAKSTFDESKLPQGLNIKKCNKMLKFTLEPNANDLKLNTDSAPVVPVSPNFALVGFTFLYSQNDCINPPSSGVYAEENLKGMSDFLTEKVQQWKIKQGIK